MTVWVLFVIYTTGLPTAGIFTYESKAACERAAENYKRYECVKVLVSK